MRAAIESDLKQALKAGEKRRVATLRLLLSAFQNERIHAGRELTDAEAEAVIRRAVRERREAIEQYTRGNREDLARAESEELEILEAYLPASLSEEEVEAAIREIIREKGYSSERQAGLVMKDLMALHRGRVDGKRAQEITRRLLA
ncbi:MAG: aspartyl-tRNA amidotransferase [Acidobacteria bacterium]|nr:MAG: aspartyl-tRNA amidotransferase [Acidobacteriota bacterium]PYQ64741.1 MAG: aspartyl-tRNA amidotransferase [Acidobacteriota bacterium]